MEHVPAYGHPEALGHPSIGSEDEAVCVTEKVDGSLAGFSRTKGHELLFRSRKTAIYPEAPGMFGALVESVTERSSLLHPGWVYYGEYLAKPKHNALAYDRIPKGHVALFDVMVGTQVYLSPSGLAAEAERIGFEAVPLFYQGVLSDPAVLEGYLTRESFLGGQLVEGVVVKNYAAFGPDSRPLMGKLVRPEFKERNASNWKAQNPTRGDVVEFLIDRYRSEARWAKAVQHLQEDGLLEHSPRDIGRLVAEVPVDIAAEDIEAIKEELFKWAWPTIRRGVVRGLPEWYKNQLVEYARSEAGVTS